MTTKPKTTKTINEMDSVSIVNATRAQLGGTYASQVPRVLTVGEKMANGRTATYNDVVMSLRGVGDIIMQYQPLQNAFLSALVNRIAKVVITSRLYENPLTRFKKGMLEMGETVEEIFVNLAKGVQFDPEKAESEVFKRRIPDVKSAFHSMNFQKFYPTTVSHDQLKQAFLTLSGLTDLISRIIEQVYTGANYDEFQVTKYMIAREALNGNIYPVKIDTLTTDNARQVTTSMVKQAKDLTFMSDKYNYAHVKNYTDIGSLQMLLTTEVESIFDVEVLALSFNMEKAELLGRKTTIDSFGDIDETRLEELFANDPYTTFVKFTEDEKTALGKLKGLMCDIDFFMIFDNFYNMTEIYNPQGLYWNYFYHVWKTFSVSPFANAVLFTEDTPAVNTVTVNPGTITTGKGTVVQLSATVKTVGFASKEVSWSITELTENSTVDQSGKVTIGANETNPTLTVKATSLFDTEKSGTCTITVQSE